MSAVAVCSKSFKLAGACDRYERNCFKVNVQLLQQSSRKRSPPPNHSRNKDLAFTALAPLITLNPGLRVTGSSSSSSSVTKSSEFCGIVRIVEIILEIEMKPHHKAAMHDVGVLEATSFMSGTGAGQLKSQCQQRAAAAKQPQTNPVAKLPLLELMSVIELNCTSLQQREPSLPGLHVLRTSTVTADGTGGRGIQHHTHERAELRKTEERCCG
jgi:hypothetical protein